MTSPTRTSSNLKSDGVPTCPACGGVGPWSCICPPAGSTISGAPQQITHSALTAEGVIWITGWREARWQTARFDIARQLPDGSDDHLALNADWPKAWRILAPLLRQHTEATMRTVLPD